MTVTTFIAYPGNGVSTLFTIPFSYIDPTHVKVGIWDQNAQTYIEKAQTDPTYGWSFAKAPAGYRVPGETPRHRQSANENGSVSAAPSGLAIGPAM